MRRLRGPDGCPWDRAQTLESLRPFVLEEAHEVLEAIEEGDPEALREELGDLLLEVVFLAQICAEKGAFDISAVARGIADKLVRRHPHVFADASASGPEEAIRRWEHIKRAERAAASGGRASLLDGVPRRLPALLRASRLSSKASASGFDWESLDQVLEKVQEEIGEFRGAVKQEDASAMAHELGDLLFACANIGRFTGIDPETELQAANGRFIERFQHVERRLKEEGSSTEQASMERMEALWGEAKREGK